MIKSMLSGFLVLFSSIVYCQETESIPKLRIGLVGGVNLSNVVVTEEFSIFSNESTSYDIKTELTAGVKYEFAAWKNLLLSVVLFREKQEYEMRRESAASTLIHSEKLKFYYGQLFLSYQFLTPGLHYTVNAGTTARYLRSASASFQPIGGVTLFTNQNISYQRRSTTFNGLIGGSVRKPFGRILLEFSANYEWGFSNLVIEENRFADTNLVIDFGYVPDDYKINNVRLALGILYSIWP